jgi:hypothetical protein
MSCVALLTSIPPEGCISVSSGSIGHLSVTDFFYRGMGFWGHPGPPSPFHTLGEIEVYGG